MTLYVRPSCDPWPLYSSCACSRVSAQSICTIRWDSNSQRTNLSKFHFRHVRNENCSIVTFRYNIYPIYICITIQYVNMSDICCCCCIPLPESTPGFLHVLLSMPTNHNSLLDKILCINHWHIGPQKLQNKLWQLGGMWHDTNFSEMLHGMIKFTLYWGYVIRSDLSYCTYINKL